MKNVLMSTTVAFALSLPAVEAQDFSYLKNASVDLRPQINEMGMAVRNQAPRGTCTIFATTFLIEFWTARAKGLKTTDFSEEYLAAAARRASTDKSDNYFFSEAAMGYEEFGIVDEKDMPYLKENPINIDLLQDESPATLELLEKGKKNRMLESEVLLGPNNSVGKPGLSDDQFRRIMTTLDGQSPVAVGYGASSTEYKMKYLPGLAAPVLESSNVELLDYAHTVPIVGYKVDKQVLGGGYFIIRDSGGAEAGDKGYRYVAFDYFRKYAYDVLIFSKTPKNVLVSNDREFIQKRWLKRKDILKVALNTRNNVRVPFVSARKLNQVLVAEKKAPGRRVGR